MAFVNKNERARQYLLGSLSDEDKSRFEEAYFEDDELFEEIEIAEGELVDAYVRDELSAGDRNKFETSLINSPRLAQRVEFARSLKKTAGSSAAVPVPSQNQPTTGSRAVPLATAEPLWRRVLFPSPKSLRFAFATYVLLFVLGGGALFFGWMRLRTESSRLASERAELEQRKQALALADEKDTSELTTQLAEARAENERLAQQLESESKSDPLPKPPDKTVAALLFPGALRSTGRRTIVPISADTSTVRLRLSLPSNDYSLYSATVKSAVQELVWSNSGIKPSRDGKVVVLVLPAAKLPPGTYLVELSGLQESASPERLEDYSFQVVRNRN